MTMTTTMDPPSTTDSALEDAVRLHRTHWAALVTTMHGEAFSEPSFRAGFAAGFRARTSEIDALLADVQQCQTQIAALKDSLEALGVWPGADVDDVGL
jgi:hypothetical protein